MSSDSGFTPGSAPSDGQPPPPQPNPTLGAPLLRTLYWASGSPPAWRALLTLAEKRIPFNSVMVTFESGILRTPAHLALNPRGLVPVLIDGPVRMYESLAIIQYLEWRYPEVPLLPGDPVARARALCRVEEANNLSSAAGEVVYYVRRTPPADINHEYLAAKTSTFHAELALWEMYLAGETFLAGNELSLADLSFFPNLAYCCRLGLRLETAYPNLFAFFTRMVGRASVLATWPPHWKVTQGLSILD